MKEEDTVRLLFIRHGDPDYEHDTLTEKGHREAALLGKLAPSLNLGQCFVSPPGTCETYGRILSEKYWKTGTGTEVAAGVPWYGRYQPFSGAAGSLP